jgi:hypothetical protein
VSLLSHLTINTPKPTPGWGPLFPLKSMARFNMTPAESVQMFLTGVLMMILDVCCRHLRSLNQALKVQLYFMCVVQGEGAVHPLTAPSSLLAPNIKH